MIKQQFPKQKWQRYSRAGFTMAAILFALWGTLLFTLQPPQPAAAAHGPRCYVDASASGAATGDSWTDAYVTVQDALANTNCTEIWVAAGVYYPDEGAGQTNDDRNSTFTLQSGVALYGGFAGTESSLSERNVAANITVLSGDIDQNDTTDANGVVTDTANIVGSNAYHVVTCSGTDSTAVLDGFFITAGQANGGTSPNNNGGGMLNDNSSPTLSNVIFSGNSADTGGGMYNTYSSPTLSNVTFSANSASNQGGGMRNYFSSPTLSNVTFSGNLAYNGGGMYNAYSNPTLTNVTFSGNSATNQGGGMRNTHISSPTLSNVTFSDNSANNRGGGMYNYLSSSPKLTNVTFSGNRTNDQGGGMYNNYDSSPTLTNVTFSANSANSGGGMYNINSSPTLTNTIIANSTSGGDCVNGTGGSIASSAHNLIEDTGANACGLSNNVYGNIVGQGPNLGPLTDFGGPGKQVFLLLSGSPAIDAGDNANCPATDQRGVVRNDGACDIGAVEASDIIFVKHDAAGAATGLSWTDAYTNVQDALNVATSGKQIWVAAGVYYPDEGAGQTNNERNSTFTLQSGVALYGGFAGTESSLSERNVAANITVLSGDIDKNDTTDANGVVTSTTNIAGSNAYHVVTSSSVNSTAVLDGFTITAGQANDIYPANNGGGMYNTNSSPTLSNVTFSGNAATNSWGGGMFNGYSSPTLSNVTFSGNSAGTGGGMRNYHSSPTLTNVTFSGNRTNDQGGGMVNYSFSSPTLSNVTFSGNWATNQGGGMVNYSFSSPTLSNVTFSGNWATNKGGGMYNYNYSSPTLTNVTFSGNSANSGGGMYNINSSPTLTNTIIANSTSGGDCVNGTGGSIASSANNLIEDTGANACGLSNNVHGNIVGHGPNLGPLTDFGGPGKQVFLLLSGSPAIDVGDNANCPATDQRGVVRNDGACDIGAYEGVAFVWDGGGGANNNWSTGPNWTGDTVPGADDDVFFDGTSTKDSVIDAGFGGAVANVHISSAYTGNITFGRSLAVSSNYSQDGGTVVVDPAHAFTVDGSFSHTGGTLQETQTVGADSTVNFLQIRNSGNTTVKYRGVDLDTNTTHSDLGSTTVSIRAVDTAAGEYCTSTNASSPPYAGRCFTITPANSLAARVTLWALTSEVPGTVTSPSVYRYNAGAWQEVSDISTGTSGSYIWVAGDTPGFSSFLIAQAGGGGGAPTAVSLQSFSASTNSTPLVSVLAAVLMGLGTAVLITRRR